MQLRHILFAALVATAPLAWGSSALAQSCRDHSCRAAAPAGNACRIFFESRAGTGSVSRTQLSRGSGRESPAGCYDPSRQYGLQGWRLHMPGGHKVREIRLLQVEGALEHTFQDGDGNDLSRGFVWLVPLPEGTRVHYSPAVNCSGTCRIPLPDKPPGATFVLMGFKFERIGGDGHISNVSINPIRPISPTRGDLTVSFFDDTFRYRAEVQYAYVPGENVRQTGAVGSTYARVEAGFGAAVVRSWSVVDTALRDTTPPGDAVLQSFAFSFRNGGHFLEDIGMERRSDGYEAWFQDNQDRAEIRQPDDPFNWAARFALITP